MAEQMTRSALRKTRSVESKESGGVVGVARGTELEEGGSATEETSQAVVLRGEKYDSTSSIVELWSGEKDLATRADLQYQILCTMIDKFDEVGFLIEGVYEAVKQDEAWKKRGPEFFDDIFERASEIVRRNAAVWNKYLQAKDKASSKWGLSAVEA